MREAAPQESSQEVPLLAPVRQPRARRAAVVLVVAALAGVAGLASLSGGASPSVRDGPGSARALNASPAGVAGRVAAQPGQDGAFPTVDPRSFSGMAAPSAPAEVAAAILALQDLNSYRFTWLGSARSGAWFSLTGVVVNDRVPRIRIEARGAGAPTTTTIQVGTQQWTRTGDAAFRASPGGEAGAGAGSGPVPPFEPILLRVLSQMGEARVDVQEGWSTRRLRIESLARSPAGAAVIDAWASVTGNLVSLHASDVGPIDAFAPGLQPASGRQLPAMDTVDLTVSAVDDASNAVDVPSGGTFDTTTGVEPPGQLVAAVAALAQRTSYRIAIQTSGMPPGSGRPVAVARPRLGVPRLERLLRAHLVDGFAVVGGAERVNGVLTTHLRARAGAHLDPEGGVVGGAQLWIAQDGGYLVRLTIDGSDPARVDVTNVGAMPGHEQPGAP